MKKLENGGDKLVLFKCRDGFGKCCISRNVTKVDRRIEGYNSRLYLFFK